MTLAQLLAAGFVGGFCVLQWVWSRGELRHAGAPWALAWSIDMTLLLAVAAAFAYTPAGLARDTLEFVHALLVGAFLVVAIPATRAFGGGPRVAPWVATVGALLTIRLALWWAPAISGAHDTVSTLSGGLLVTASAIVVAYVVAACGRLVLDRFGVLVVVALVESLAVFVAALVVPSAVVGPILGGLWAIPLALALEVVALRQLRTAQDRSALAHRMRDAQTRIANAAWYAKDADALLVEARDTARDVLRAPTIEASLRPISRGRFVTELFVPGTQPELEPHVRTFLLDVAHVVSTAAERYALTRRLHDTAYADALTGLPNRRAVGEHLTDVLDRANVERTRVSLVYCDVDAFKRVNDLHGHAAGDELLRRVADYLRAFTPDPDTFVGRLGGDEFVLVISRAPDDAALVGFARRLRDGFLDRSVDSRPARLTVGVATWVPGDVVDVDALVRHADTAMLEAKRSRSGYRVFDRALRRRVEAERVRRSALESAVENDLFVAHFQPIVDSETLEIALVEALARWNHHGNLVMPAEWLDLAEESGLIVPIGLSVLRQARRALDRFQMPVAVNVAARQLSEPDALDQIEDAWGDAYWEHLTLEITESALVQTSFAIPVLSELRARGARIAVDDFGTGYSSIARLSRLPVDVLKVDRSFVRELGTDRGRGAVRAIVALAETHGLTVVAEGVETAQHLTSLVDLGVRFVQGNFLGRATPGLPVRGPRPTTGALRTLRAVPSQQTAPDLVRRVTQRH